MHNPHRPRGVISERRHRAPDQTSRIAAATRQRRPVSSQRSWILPVISWLGSAIVEGFALYGQSIYPCGADLSQDCRTQAAEADRPAATPLPAPENPWLPRGRSSHDIDIRLFHATASSHLPQKMQRWFHLALILPRRRTEGRKRPDMPNDRSLRDDGADPLDIGPGWQRFDPFP